MQNKPNEYVKIFPEFSPFSFLIIKKFGFQFLTFQNILLEAGLMIQGEINFNMAQIAESALWLNTEGEIVSDWLLENVA